MENNLMQDERTLAQNRKIRSSAYNLLVFALFISLVVKQYVLKLTFSQYATELICILFSYLYIVVRSIIGGSYLYGTTTKGRNIILDSLLGGGVMTLTIASINYLTKDNLIELGVWFLPSTFISASIGLFIGFSFVHQFNKNIQQKIVKKLDEEENEIN